MRRFTYLLPAFIAFALLGCPQQPASSLHGLYDDGEPIVDEGLVGNWEVIPAIDEETGEPKDERFTTYVSVSLDGKDYAVTIRRGHRVQRMTAQLYQLDGAHILDTQLMDESAEGPAAESYVPPHRFFKVEKLDDGYRLSFFSQDWLESHRSASHLNVGHTTVNDAVFLTAEPEALRQYFLEYANAGDAKVEAWAPLGSKMVRSEGGVPANGQ